MFTWRKRGTGKNDGYGVYMPDGELLCACTYKRGAVAATECLNRYAKAMGELDKVCGILNDEDLCAEAMVAEIGEIVHIEGESN